MLADRFGLPPAPGYEPAPDTQLGTREVPEFPDVPVADVPDVGWLVRHAGRGTIVIVRGPDASRLATVYGVRRPASSWTEGLALGHIQPPECCPLWSPAGRTGARCAPPGGPG